MQMNKIRTATDLLTYLDQRLTECDELIVAYANEPTAKAQIEQYARGLHEARQAAQQLTIPAATLRRMDALDAKINRQTAKSAQL